MQIDTSSKIYQGALFEQDFQWIVGGVGQDISSLTSQDIKATFTDPANGSCVFTLDLDSGISTTDAINGKFRVTVTDAESSAATVNGHFLYYQLEIAKTTGAGSARLAEGYVPWSPQIACPS